MQVSYPNQNNINKKTSSPNKLPNNLSLNRINSTGAPQHINHKNEYHQNSHPHNKKDLIVSSHNNPLIISQPAFESSPHRNANHLQNNNPIKKPLVHHHSLQQGRVQERIRYNQVDTSRSKQKQLNNILKFMQQQLQLTRKKYQAKFTQALKAHTIEISKLAMKIRNNEQLIEQKNRKIYALEAEIISMQKNPGSIPKRSSTLHINQFQCAKICDIQQKCQMLAQIQNQLSRQNQSIGYKVTMVQKGLLKLFASKIAKIDHKLQVLISNHQHKIDKIENQLHNLMQNFRIQRPTVSNMDRSREKQIVPQINSIYNQIDFLKAEVYNFKTRQLKYENIHISQLETRLKTMAQTVYTLQAQYSPNNKLNISKASKISKKNKNNTSFQNYRVNDSFSKIESSSSFFLSNNNSMLMMMKQNQGDQKSKSSVYFDDYHTNNQDLNSTYTQGQFFHPMSSSFQKNQHSLTYNNNSNNQITYTIPLSNKIKTKNTQNPHNDSFQNFTSDQEQQQSATQTENQLRIKRMIKTYNMKIPVPLHIYPDGRIKVAGYGQFLVDENDNYLGVLEFQVKKLNAEGYITPYY